MFEDIKERRRMQKALEGNMNFHMHESILYLQGSSTSGVLTMIYAFPAVVFAVLIIVHPVFVAGFVVFLGLMLMTLFSMIRDSHRQKNHEKKFYQELLDE